MERTRKVNPECVNATNPFHQCADYCSPRAAGPEPRSPAPRSAQNGVTSKEEEAEGSRSSRRKVDPLCVNASNPFHQCAEYCSPRTPGAGRPNGRERSAQNGVTSKEEEAEGSRSSRRKVDPLCVNASNPFHQCAEYCSPRTPGAGRPNGRERLVSNGVHTLKNGKVDPTCVNASNPFHVCGEYCSQKKNGASHVNGTKSGSSTPHGSKRSFKFVERDDVDPNCVNASNPFHKCADYCLQKKQWNSK